MTWVLIGEDPFHETYREGDLMFKLPLSANINPSREAQVWSAINPEFKAVVRTIAFEDETLYGWAAPYIEATAEKPTDEEISDTLVDIFNRTGLIIPDAFTPGHFIKTADHKIMCVNVSSALQMEQREGIFLSGLPQIKKDKNANVWKNLEPSYQKKFDIAEKNYPKTVNTIKALFFTKAQRPAISNVDFLKDDEDCKILAQSYSDPSKIEDGLNTLQTACPSDFEDIQRQCVSVLTKYLESLGKLDREKISLKPFVSTKLLKSKMETYQSFLLIQEINKAQSYAELQRAFTNFEIRLPQRKSKNIAQNLRDFFGSNTINNLSSALNICEHLINDALSIKSRSDSNTTERTDSMDSTDSIDSTDSKDSPTSHL